MSELFPVCLSVNQRFRVYIVVPNLLLTDVGSFISTSADNSTSGTENVFGQESISGFTVELRPPRTCDLRTIEVVSARFTSPARTLHYGRRNEIAGRWNEIQLAIAR